MIQNLAAEEKQRRFCGNISDSMTDYTVAERNAGTID